MGAFRLLTGLSANLSNQPLSDGTVYFTKDDGKMYLDKMNGSSIERFLINYNQIEYITSDMNTAFITKRGVFYVYEDLIGKSSCLKIGDGKAYLVDMPFIDEHIMEHINNTDIHVTPEEKKFWNNKVTCYLDSADAESLVFTKE